RRSPWRAPCRRSPHHGPSARAATRPAGGTPCRGGEQRPCVEYRPRPRRWERPGRRTAVSGRLAAGRTIEPMGQLDRRAFPARTGRLVAGLSLASAWTLVGDALGAVDPRLRALAHAVSGPVITPADAAYTSARLVYNERFDAVHPLGIVQPV